MVELHDEAAVGGIRDRSTSTAEAPGRRPHRACQFKPRRASTSARGSLNPGIVILKFKGQAGRPHFRQGLTLICDSISAA